MPSLPGDAEQRCRFLMIPKAESCLLALQALYTNLLKALGKKIGTLEFHSAVADVNQDVL